MKIEYQIRPSSRSGSNKWVVETHRILSRNNEKTTFSILNKKWFDNEDDALEWVIKTNTKNLPVKLGRFSY